MPYYTGLASDYAQLMKEEKKNKQGVSQWEQFFLQPLQQQYASAITEAQSQAQYDIAGAYSAYQASLRQSKMSSMWTGQKEQVSNYLENAYKSTYANALQKQESSIGQAASSYSEALTAENKRLTEIGAQFSNLEQLAYKYAKENEDFGDVDLSKFYTIGNDGAMSLNEAGMDFWDRVLNAKYDDGETRDFATYLSEENPSMYNFYRENIGQVRSLVGGLDPADFEYSAKERPETLTSQIKYSDRLVGQVDKIFETVEERTDYVRTMNAKLELAKRYVVKPKINQKGSWSNRTLLSVEFDGQKYIPALASASGDVRTVKAWTLIGRGKTNPYSIGDVVSFDGEKYYYVKGKDSFVELKKQG